MKKKKVKKVGPRIAWALHCYQCSGTHCDKEERLAVFRTRSAARENLPYWPHAGGQVRVIQIEAREI